MFTIYKTPWTLQIAIWAEVGLVSLSPFMFANLPNARMTHLLLLQQKAIKPGQQRLWKILHNLKRFPSLNNSFPLASIVVTSWGIENYCKNELNRKLYNCGNLFGVALKKRNNCLKVTKSNKDLKDNSIVRYPRQKKSYIELWNKKEAKENMKE